MHISSEYINMNRIHFLDAVYNYLIRHPFAYLLFRYFNAFANLAQCHPTCRYRHHSSPGWRDS
ncbi:hypothetical protein PSEUDO8Z_140096 [Pseudomonas sp. 8Z]|nr:hypothetical protein PSEUDO8Z_140096 [Pseudomonas sp. 8Z]